MSRTATRDTFSTGARVGDYTIERGLGSEETGVVYLGTHVVLPRQAAIKVMHASSAWLRAVAVQMLREACLLEALSHPGIPRVYECGVLPDRRPWTAFERIEGVTLASMVASSPLGVAELTLMIREVADILHHAHTRGVVHRKLTADAIIRTPDRMSAICVRHWDDALTIDTEVRVSVDARDDVHALGVVAFRALTGALPDRTVSAAERCPAAPAELSALIDHMLGGDPAARPTSAEVRDRARWLSDTLVPLAIERPRWTPPHGLPPDRLPALDDDGGGFAIRIARKS